MKREDQWEESSGEVHTAERHFCTREAQLSRAPLGTCLRVGSEVWRMESSEGGCGAGAISVVGGGAGSDGTERDWGAGSWLRQSPASPGKQQEQGLPFLTQEHLKHFPELLQQQHRGLGRVGDRACGT